jgi:hypothetical protein
VSWDFNPIVDALISHALSLGVYDSVSGHEPTNPPGRGMKGAIWMDKMIPIPERSGQASTSMLLVANVRSYMPTTQRPQDAIDPLMVTADGLLREAYSGDFTFGGAAAFVDLLGAYGVNMTTTAGYLIQDSGSWRVYTLAVPIVVDDVFAQMP